MNHKTCKELCRIAMNLGPLEDSSDTRAAAIFAKKLKSFTGYIPEESDPEQIKAIWEIAKRFAGKRTSIYLKPKDIWEEMRDIRTSKKEHFVTFFLDTSNQEIRRDIVSIGTLNYNLVHPREVFKPAIEANAAGIIMAHNHPSGSLAPSDEDRTLTKRLRDGGKLLGIEILDHIIVTKDGFSSFKQKNLI